MVFRKGGILPRNLSFTFQGNMIEIVNKFVYLGISFSTGGSFTETHKTLSGQALKAIFKLNQYLYKFTDISPKHTLELVDKLITPILTYGGEEKFGDFQNLYNRRECTCSFVISF